MIWKVDERTRAIEQLQDNWPRHFSNRSLRMLTGKLRDVPDNVVIEVLDRIVEEEEWPPSISKIKSRCRGRMMAIERADRKRRVVLKPGGLDENGRPLMSREEARRELARVVTECPWVTKPPVKALVLGQKERKKALSENIDRLYYNALRRCIQFDGETEIELAVQEEMF